MKKNNSIDKLIQPYTELSVASKSYKRTSFNLPKNIIDKLSDVSRYFRSSKKDLVSGMLDNEKFLEGFASAMSKSPQVKMGKFGRQSILLSTKAYTVLDKVAKRKKVKKSALVGLVILMLESIMIAKLESHKNALEILKDFEKLRNDVEEKLRGLLQKDDPVLWIFGYTGVFLDNTIMAINDELKNKILIDESEYS